MILYSSLYLAWKCAQIFVHRHICSEKLNWGSSFLAEWRLLSLLSLKYFLQHVQSFGNWAVSLGSFLVLAETYRYSGSWCILDKSCEQKYFNWWLVRCVLICEVAWHNFLRLSFMERLPRAKKNAVCDFCLWARSFSLDNTQCLMSHSINCSVKNNKHQ